MRNDMERRIRKAEEAMDRAQSALDGLEEALEWFKSAGDDFVLLEEYLNSDERREALSADEDGELPEDMMRGVLSEDGIWNLLERRNELINEMKDL